LIVFNTLIFWLADIQVSPDFNGLPPNLTQGLMHLTNNAAAVLLLVAGLGIVGSLTGWVAGSVTQNPQLIDRSKDGLKISVGAGAALYVAVAAANYGVSLFR
jgi:hypothetical protein